MVSLHVGPTDSGPCKFYFSWPKSVSSLMSLPWAQRDGWRSLHQSFPYFPLSSSLSTPHSGGGRNDLIAKSKDDSVTTSLGLYVTFTTLGHFLVFTIVLLWLWSKNNHRPQCLLHVRALRSMPVSTSFSSQQLCEICSIIPIFQMRN